MTAVSSDETYLAYERFVISSSPALYSNMCYPLFLLPLQFRCHYLVVYPLSLVYL